MIDPWLDLYFAASLEPGEATLERLPLLVDAAPCPRGDALAIAARTARMLGFPVEAEAYYRSALELGGAEVEALASLREADGGARAQRRVSSASSPGLRADAACDVAAHACNAGELPRARLAITEGLAANPDHREARSWARFLAEPDAPEAWVRAGLRGFAPDEADRAGRSALRLRPLARRGWVSEMRLECRYFAGPDAAMAPRDSAMERLIDAGCLHWVLGTGYDWHARPRHDALALAELALQDVGDLVDEGRSAEPAARRLWAGALASNDLERGTDTAQWLCAAATRDRGLRGLGRTCADFLVALPHENAPLFAAYAAWFAADDGDPAARALAAAVLERDPVDGVSLRLAVSALRALELPDVARALLARHALDPSNARLVEQLAAEPDLVRPRVECSPRIVPRRGARRAAGPEAARH
jgi:hypothetical protein